MMRVGIDVSQALGVSVPNIREVAKRCGTDQTLARELRRNGVHEARILATQVKKGVSWALRQIGKRNRPLHGAAVDEANTILALDGPSARWIARDALRELESGKTRSRLPE